MIRGQYISLIVPCKNEAVALKAALHKVPRVVDEIIVINNGSTDNTVRIAKKLGATVLSEERNKKGIGYGFAHAKGIQEARGDIIVCMDGDGSYPVKEIPRLVNHLIKQKLDFISCNRLPFKNPKDMSLVRIMGVNILNLMTFLLFQKKIKDSLSGMWVFRRNLREELPLFEGGWNFSLEIKLSAITNQNIKFSEYHIPYHDRIFDASKQNIFQTGLEHSIFLFKYKMKLILAKMSLPIYQESISLLSK